MSTSRRSKRGSLRPIAEIPEGRNKDSKKKKCASKEDTERGIMDERKGEKQQHGIAGKKKPGKETGNEDENRPQFKDEAINLLVNETAIENYFNQGKLKDQSSNNDADTADVPDQTEKIRDKDEKCFNFVKNNLNLLSHWFETCDNYIPNKYKEECANAGSSFPRWLTYLASGFNLIRAWKDCAQFTVRRSSDLGVLCNISIASMEIDETTADQNSEIYGLGSKRNLLQNFCEKGLKDYTYIVVDGFKPAVNTHVIFQRLVTELSLNLTITTKNHLEYSNAVGRAIDRRGEDVVLVLHNIDGPAFRVTGEQWALSEFAKARHTHIIASVDHINSCLLWTKKFISAFNFLFINVNTMRAYKTEVFASNSTLLGLNVKSSRYKHSLVSLDVVWISLTSNSRSLLHLICTVYYRQMQPIKFFELYHLARGEFLVSTDTAMRQHLNEYSDHHLIERKRQNDGNEYIAMTVDKEIMVAFMKEKGLSLDDDISD